MQASWRKDTDKLTFIICRPLSPSTENSTIMVGEADKPERMIGDVNMFLSLAHDEDSEGEEIPTKPFIKGELELMIATNANRRKGYGRATLMAFMAYIRKHEEEIITDFLAGEGQVDEKAARCIERGLELGVKIGEGNKSSKGLFESMGFEQVGEVNYFGEVELKLKEDKKIDDIEGWREAAYEK